MLDRLRLDERPQRQPDPNHLFAAHTDPALLQIEAQLEQVRKSGVVVLLVGAAIAISL